MLQTTPIRSSFFREWPNQTTACGQNIASVAPERTILTASCRPAIGVPDCTYSNHRSCTPASCHLVEYRDFCVFAPTEAQKFWGHWLSKSGDRRPLARWCIPLETCLHIWIWHGSTAMIYRCLIHLQGRCCCGMSNCSPWNSWAELSPRSIWMWQTNWS